MKASVIHFDGQGIIRYAETRPRNGKAKPGEVLENKRGFTDVVAFSSGAQLIQERSPSGKVQSCVLKDGRRAVPVDAQIKFDTEVGELKVHLHQGAMHQTVFDSGETRLGFQTVPGETLNSAVTITSDGQLGGWIHMHPEDAGGSYLSAASVDGDEFNFITEDGHSASIGFLLAPDVYNPERVCR